MDDDDSPTLSLAALAALAEFYHEQEEREADFQKIWKTADEEFQSASSAPTPTPNYEKISMDLFKEDWQLSQFWYDEVTIQALTKEILAQTNLDDMIICISTPSVFVNLMTETNKSNETTRNVVLLEFDQRFKVYGDRFIPYDYNDPLNSLSKQQAALIILDPPFLSEECLTKTAKTVKHLINPENGKIILCTGRIMEGLALDLLQVKLVPSFQPNHKGGLSNEFGCFTNFPPKFNSPDE